MRRFVATLLLSFLPFLMGAKVLIDFGGWTAKDLEVCRSFSGLDTDIKTTPTPPAERIGTQVFNLTSAAGGTTRHFCTESYTHASSAFSVFGMYVHFSGAFNPVPEYELIRSTEAGSETTTSAYHWYIKIENTSNKLDVYDANGSKIRELTWAPVISTWYLIEIAWTKHDTVGKIDFYVDGDLKDAMTSLDTKNGTGTAETVCVGGQGGFASDVSTPSVLSWYLYDNAVPDDRLGEHDVIGPYSTDHASKTRECGDNDPNSNFNTLIDTPFGGSSNVLLSGTTGRQCNGSTQAGPATDSRITETADMRGMKCVAKFLIGDAFFQCGSFDSGDTPNCTIVQAVKCVGACVSRIIIEEGDAAMPDDNRFAVLNWQRSGIFGSTASDMTAAILQEATPGFTLLDFERPTRGSNRGQR